MNKHIGYIMRDKQGRNMTPQQIFRMGFRPIEDLLSMKNTTLKPHISAKKPSIHVRKFQFG